MIEQLIFCFAFIIAFWAATHFLIKKTNLIFMKTHLHFRRLLKFTLLGIFFLGMVSSSIAQTPPTKERPTSPLNDLTDDQRKQFEQAVANIQLPPM